jgi:glycerol kinase
LAEGVWSSLDDLTNYWQLDAEFAPSITQGAADAKHAQWTRAVERARLWETG